MSTTVGLAIPQPSQLVDVVNLCQSIEAQLPYVEDVGQLKDAEFKLRAIDEYLALTSTEGRQAVAATIYRIQVRAGQIVPEMPMGRPRHDSESVDPDLHFPIERQERYHLRLMGAHPDIVEQEIAKGTDERPTTRKQVLTAIKEHKAAQRAAHESDYREDREWIASLGPNPDPEGDRKAQKIRQAIIGLAIACERLDEFSADDVAWALGRSAPHLRAKMLEHLEQAWTTIERITEERVSA